MIRGREAMPNGVFPQHALAGRFVRRVAPLLLLLPGSASADWRDACPPAAALLQPASEEVITINTAAGRIIGTLAAPANSPPDALVLLLHGYTGARNEIPVAGGEGMFARAARAFARQGIASLRIDFIGSGESDGSWADTTFSTQARDAVEAATWLRTRYGSENLGVGVLGYSQGGLVALRAAATHDPFDRLALWNPVMDPMATYGLIFGQETILKGARQDREPADNDVVEETRLRPGFFAELVNADPIADAAHASGPVLIVTGRRDPLVQGGAALAEEIAAARGSETAIIDLDAGHDLGAINNPSLLDDVIGCTGGFLRGEAEE